MATRHFRHILLFWARSWRRSMVINTSSLQMNEARMRKIRSFMDEKLTISIRNLLSSKGYFKSTYLGTYFGTYFTSASCVPSTKFKSQNSLQSFQNITYHSAAVTSSKKPIPGADIAPSARHLIFFWHHSCRN